MTPSARSCRVAAAGPVAAGLLALALPLDPAVAQEMEERVPTSAEVEMKVKYPMVRVPFLQTPPRIDARMDPGEWEDAAAYTGFWQDFGGGNPLYLATREKQPTFWFAYDKDNLYFAHRSDVFPEGSWLKCKGKYTDVDGHPDYGVLWDDHVELCLTPTPLQHAARQKGYFKWLFNPIDTYADIWYTPMGEGPKQKDLEWNSGCELKGRWDEKTWVTEMRVPLKSFIYGDYSGKDDQGRPYVELPLRDGTVWLNWSARALGAGIDEAKFFSMKGGGWTQPNLHMVFDSHGVSAQVIDLGYLSTDQVDLQIEVKNHGERSEAVKVGFFIENETELIVANEDDAIFDLLPGERKSIRLKREKIGIGPLRNSVWVDIRTLSGRLVHQSKLMRFHHIMGLPDFKEVFLDGMKLYRDPRMPFEFSFAYYPYKDSIYARVDTDVFGSTEESRTAVEAKINVAAENGDVVHTASLPLEVPRTPPGVKTYGGRMGHTVTSFPKLKEGNYKVTCLLYDTNKKIVGDLTSNPFLQAAFPWEHNREGLTDTVWPPYTALAWAAESSTLQTLMHEFKLAADGLPVQITIRGKNPAYGPQLRAPMRLEASAGGRRFCYEPASALRQTQAGKSETVFESAGALGPVKVRTRAQYDCDGYLLYDLHYQTGKAPLDTLELVIELAGPMDLLGLNSPSQALKSEYLRRPAGVVWNSRDDEASRELFYGNFMPHVFIGNGDRAFAWLCETDRGMKLLATNAAAQIEKSDAGAFTLRFFFVNEPGPVEEERRVRFAWATLPTKPQSKDHRALNWFHESHGGGPMISDGGYQSRSIHLVRDEHYALYQPLLLEMATGADGKPAPRLGPDGKPLKTRPYTTINMISWDMPGFKNLTYTGEWTGKTDIRPTMRGYSHVGGVARQNPVTGTPWNTLYLQCANATSWCQSKTDCWVYWRSKQIRLAGCQGWWWDHTIYGVGDYDPVVGNAYWLPPHKYHAMGRLQHAFHYFQPRQFFKRLARIWTENRMPINNIHWAGLDAALQEPFGRDSDRIEGAAGYGGGFPHMFQYDMDTMRFFANNYVSMNGWIAENIDWTHRPGADPMLERSVIAHALLHDLGVNPGRLANRFSYEQVVAALKAFGYFEDVDVVEFIPYWRSGTLFRYGPDTEQDAKDEFATPEDKQRMEANRRVLCTIYRHTKTGKALLALANNSPAPVMDYLYVSPQLLGREWTKGRDVEVGQDLSRAYFRAGNNWDWERWIPNTFAPVFIAPWQFRLIELE